MRIGFAGRVPIELLAEPAQPIRYLHLAIVRMLDVVVAVVETEQVMDFMRQGQRTIRPEVA